MFGFTVVKIDFNYICYAKYILNKNEIITNNNLVKVLYIYLIYLILFIDYKDIY